MSGTLDRTPTRSSLDRSYEYDHVGRLATSHSGTEARAAAYSGQWGTTDGPYSQGYDYDQWGNVTHKYGWGSEVQGGSPASSTDIYYNYTDNRRNGLYYDASGNLTNDIGQAFTYDATGQQTASSYTNLQNSYDGDGLRVKRTEDGLNPALFLRSTVLGGQIVAEIDYINGSWQWQRGYVYQGSQLLAVQYAGAVYWMHEDPVTKSKRVTDASGNVVSTVELDPWGADTPRSSNVAFQPKKFTSYERDANGSDEAMFRRYNRWHSRFDQPDPYDGSYSLTDPQSFNRYAYTQGDPVNLVDPSGLDPGDPVVRIYHSEPWLTWSGGRDGGLRYHAPPYVVEPRDRSAEPQNPKKDGDTGTPCSDALAVARGTTAGVNRAQDNEATLKDVAGQYGNVIDWKVLGAIGVRESNFQNIAEAGGGPGRGVFQISIAASASITGDVRASANFVMQNILMPSYNAYVNAYGQDLALRGALRDYNHTHASTPGILDNAQRKGYFDELDSGTRNYVTNVLNIARKCLI